MRLAFSVPGGGYKQGIPAGTPPLTPPGPPSSLAVGTTTSSTVPLTWSSPTTGGVATSIVVERSAHSAGSYSVIATLSGSATSYTDTGRTASTAYDYRVKASNTAGDSSYTSTVTGTTAAGLVAPGAPAGVAGTATGTTTASVSLTPAGTGGAVASWDYTLATDSGFTAGVVTGNTGTSPVPFTVPGLTPGTTYYVRAAARNAAGVSAWVAGGSTFATDAASPGVAPGPPSAVSGESVPHPQGANLVLTAPTTGGPPLGYDYEFATNSGFTTGVVSGTHDGVSAPVGVYPLVPGTAYYVRARARNAAGNSAWVASAGPFTTTANTAPGTPTGLTATAVTSSRVFLSWTAPASGGVVLGYVIEWADDAGFTTNLKVGDTGRVATTFTMAGLPASATRYVRVSARGPGGTGNPGGSARASGGTGTPTSAITVTTLADPAAPNAPTGLTAGTPTSTSVPLSWTAPASGGAVESYQVQWATDSAFANPYYFPVRTYSPATSYTALWLSPGTTYWFRVRSENAAFSQQSAWSSSVSATTAGLPTYRVPEPLLSTVVSSSAVDLAWASVSGATAYNLERSTDLVNWVAVASPTTNSHSDTGLSPLTTYHYRVRATDGTTPTAWTLYDRATTFAASGNTLATIGVTPGKVVHLLAVPQGALPSGQSPQAGSYSTQVDVKTRWPDSSLATAVLSYVATATGNVTVAAGTAATGTFTPVVPTVVATLTLTSQGTGNTGYPVTAYSPARVYTATMPTAVPGSGLWQTGPNAVSWGTLVVPLRTDDSSATPHTFLRVYFQPTVWSDGQYECQVIVENCWDVTQQTMVTLSLSVAVNGSTALTQSSWVQKTLKRQIFRITSGVSKATITHDVAALQAGGFLPRYETQYVDPLFEVDASTGSDFAPGGKGTIPVYSLGDPGEDNRFGPISGVGAKYIVHPSAGQLAAVLALGDTAGNWDWHLRMPATGSPPDVDGAGMHDFWWTYSFAYGLEGDSIAPDYPAAEHSHLVSTVLLPYLLTGDAFYADEMRFIAAWSATAVANDATTLDRKNFVEGFAQTRGLPWSLLSLINAITFLPSTDPLVPGFRRNAVKNLDYYGVGQVPGPYGIVCGVTGNMVAGTFQLWYLLTALDQVDRFRADPASTRSGRKLFKRVVSFMHQWNVDPAWNPLYVGGGIAARGYQQVGPSESDFNYAYTYPTPAASFAGQVTGEGAAYRFSLGYPARGPWDVDPNDGGYYTPHQWAGEGAGVMLGLPSAQAARDARARDYRYNDPRQNSNSNGFYYCPGIAVRLLP